MSQEKILKGALSAYTISNSVLNVLRNPNIWKIGFDLNGLSVTGMRYSVVAEAIYQGKISCEVVDQFNLQQGETLEPGTYVAAKYKPPANTMFFPREDFGDANAYEQAVILHEATHAMFDLYAKTNYDRVLKIDDESAAVLAQAFYLRLCANSDPEAVKKFKYIGNDPGDLALKLADRIIAERFGFDKAKQTYFLKDPRTYFLRPEQTASLRDAVRWKWELIENRSGTLSIYDGVVNCFSCLVRQK